MHSSKCSKQIVSTSNSFFKPPCLKWNAYRKKWMYRWNVASIQYVCDQTVHRERPQSSMGGWFSTRDSSSRLPASVSVSLIVSPLPGFILTHFHFFLWQNLSHEAKLVVFVALTACVQCVVYSITLGVKIETAQNKAMALSTNYFCLLCKHMWRCENSTIFQIKKMYDDDWQNKQTNTGTLKTTKKIQYPALMRKAII